MPLWAVTKSKLIWVILTDLKIIHQVFNIKMMNNNNKCGRFHIVKCFFILIFTFYLFEMATFNRKRKTTHSHWLIMVRKLRETHKINTNCNLLNSTRKFMVFVFVRCDFGTKVQEDCQVFLSLFCRFAS